MPAHLRGTTPAAPLPTPTLGPVFTDLAAVLSRHVSEGCAETRTALPGGYRVALRTRQRGQLQAALFAPGPQRRSERIALGRFAGVCAGSAATRVLRTVARYAPALPGLRDTVQNAAQVAAAMNYGEPSPDPDSPGGVAVAFGPATAWLYRNTITITCGRGNGARLVLEGPWDYLSLARVADSALWEATWLDRLDPARVAALLPASSPAAVRPCRWHPAATLLNLPEPADVLTSDPLGRGISRHYSVIARQLREAAPELAVQKLISNEGAIVTLRISRADTEVTPLYGYIVRWTPDRPGNKPGEGSGTTVTVYRPRRSP